LSDFGHGAADRVHKFTGNFGEKARGF
jgi:hypothetical protein